MLTDKRENCTNLEVMQNLLFKKELNSSSEKR